MNFSPELLKLADEAEVALAPQFAHIAAVARENTARVMNAFAEHRVDAACFAASSGYGYDDRGREVLDRIFADVMGAEAAFARHSIVNGTHALTIGLFGL
ncbi:MAG: methionine gamma-lyase family protein, partial [Clostridia bacterium]|nr:methionine gamma-lyase family protein [Clostridia bacterium]